MTPEARLADSKVKVLTAFCVREEIAVPLPIVITLIEPGFSKEDSIRLLPSMRSSPSLATRTFVPSGVIVTQSGW